MSRRRDVLTAPQRRLLRELARPGYSAVAVTFSAADVRDDDMNWKGKAFGPSLAKLERLKFVEVERHVDRRGMVRIWRITHTGHAFLEGSTLNVAPGSLTG